MSHSSKTQSPPPSPTHLPPLTPGSPTSSASITAVSASSSSASTLSAVPARRRLNPASGPRRRRNPENNVATLQLCVGRRCLIFQILHTPSVPQSLINFLANPSYTFTGFGIHNGAQKLAQDHNLVVGNMQDLGTLAADVYGVGELKHARMKELVVRILGREVCRPKRIIRSKWYDEWLTMAQVQFACIDAFLSFEIGRILMAGNRN